MNVLKVIDIEGNLVEEIEITPNNTTEMISELTDILVGADEADLEIGKVLYPAKMPKNGVLEVLKSNMFTFQNIMKKWTNVELAESAVDTWIKGGFSKVDIMTPEYWKARGFEGDIEEHAELIDQYQKAIEAVKIIDKQLRKAGLLAKGLKFGTYCYTLKSKKD